MECERACFPKMYPGVWPNHPILPHEHADETGQTQTPPAGLRAFVITDEVFPKGEEAMEVVYERCCGLDVHRDMVVACLSIIEAGQRRKELRTFRTVTKESAFHEAVVARLQAAATWEWRVPECCGVPSLIGWQATRELVLVNAAHLRQVPGRKTDVQDADWLADLRASWVAHAQLCARSAQAEICET